MRLLKLANYTLPEHDGTDRITQSPRSSIVGLRNGGYDNDGNELVLTPNRLSRNTTVIETEDIDDTLFNLGKQLAYGRQLITAVLTDNTTLYHTWGKLVRFGRDANADKWGCEYPINLEWAQDYPYWINDTDDSSYADMGLLADDGEFADDGHYDFVNSAVINVPVNLTFTSTNDGNVPVYRLFIYIYATTNINNPILTNETNGYFIKYNGILTTGQKLVIDCLSKKATINFTDNVYGNIELGSNQMEWMKLELGVNNWRLTADTAFNSVTSIVQWSRHYL